MAILFWLIPLPRPRSSLFPYTTLFRSVFVWGLVSDWVYALALWCSVRLVGLWTNMVQNYWTMFVHRPTSRTDRKSTRLNSSHANISYARFCFQKQNAGTH